MKIAITYLLLSTLLTCVSVNAQDAFEEGVELIDSATQDALEQVYDDTVPMSSEEEYNRYNGDRVFKVGGKGGFRFPQTIWDECHDPDFSGNYMNAKCAGKRRISKILLNFMKDNMYQCVQEASDAADLGTVKNLHIQHRGIGADKKHSRRSLHAERRAIDVKSLTMKMSTGDVVQQVYAKQGNDKFFTELRKCWGKAVNEWNGCPVLKGGYARTGSIGAEDPRGRHNEHIHMSVPYCVRGKYAKGYFIR